MKEIYIYTPYWSIMGGGEKYVLTLASVLAQCSKAKVNLLSDCKNITKEKLANFAKLDLDNLSFLSGTLNDLTNRIPEESIFICLSNFRTYLSRAKHHVQLLQIPYGKINNKTIVKKILSGRGREGIKDIYRRRFLDFVRFRADMVIVNSQFVHDVLANNFDIKSEVLYPPIKDFYQAEISKKKYILSVGRFFHGLYNEKRYDALTETFRKIFLSGVKDWEYHIVGSAANDHETNSYLDLLRETNKDYPVYFHINADYDTLIRLYSKASIFWHGAGFGINEDKEPERTEHFGMTTVEAMSAGCIPVVINKGGQREIINDSVDGLLWNSLDQLGKLTLDIIENRINTAVLRKQAQARAVDFSLSVFTERVKHIFKPLLTL